MQGYCGWGARWLETGHGESLPNCALVGPVGGCGGRSASNAWEAQAVLRIRKAMACQAYRQQKWFDTGLLRWPGWGRSA